MTMKRKSIIVLVSIIIGAVFLLPACHSGDHTGETLIENASVYIVSENVAAGDVIMALEGQKYKSHPDSSLAPTEAADDVILTPGGPRYRSHYFQEGVENPWAPVETTSILLSANNKTVDLTYRADIEIKAGEAASNILLINTTLEDIRSLKLYAVDLPNGIAIKERARWHGSLPSLIAPVIIIEVSQDIQVQEYSFEIGLEINDVDFGVIPCRLEVLPGL
jgi:hypothetical protein